MMVDHTIGSRLPKLPLGSNGRWITDNSGRVVMVRGVNMINKLPPYTLNSTGFGENDAKLLKENGFNVVRVGVIYSALEPAPGVYDEHYLREIKKTVDMLYAYDVMSLIDFHQDGWGTSFVCEGFPDWATLTSPYPIRPLRFTAYPGLLDDPPVITAWDNFWQNANGPGNVGLQDRFAAAWKYAAGFLAVTDGVFGWELLNEPFPANSNAQALTLFTQKVVDAIRQADTEHMIWYEPFVTFDWGEMTKIGTINDPANRIGFAFHNYRNVDDDYAKVWVNAFDQFLRSGNAPLCTEFGAIPVAATIDSQMNSIDAAMMPAIYWAYWNRTPYQIDGPYQAPQMGLVYDPALPLEGSNVQWDNLAALARPYPMLVAGIPSGWTFEQGVFTFVYNRMKDSPTDDTLIFVPRSVYGDKPSISVDGGRLVLLLDQIAVISATGPTTVTVTITPPA